MRQNQIAVVRDTTRRHLYTYIRVDVIEGRIGGIEIAQSLEQFDAYISGSLRTQALGSASAVAIAAVLALLLGVVFIGRPISRLAAKARRVGTGDLTGPLELRQRDELGELATEINNMCTRLAEAGEQLRHADRLKTVGMLAAGIAHELGTPLNVVAGSGLLANDTDADGGPLTAELVSGPAHGTLALAADGSFTYTLAANYNGPDSFTYRTNDGTAPGNVATKAWRHEVLSRGPMPAFSCAAMVQITADESNPPDRQVPIGTSLRIRSATASWKISRKRSTRSASLAGIAGRWSTVRHQRRISNFPRRSHMQCPPCRRRTSLQRVRSLPSTLKASTMSRRATSISSDTSIRPLRTNARCSDAKTKRSVVNAYNSGLMPKRSRARNSSSVLVSKIASAHIPLKRVSMPSRHACHAARMTSVSDWLRKLAPCASSSRRSSRKL